MHLPWSQARAWGLSRDVHCGVHFRGRGSTFKLEDWAGEVPQVHVECSASVRGDVDQIHENTAGS